VTEKKKEKRGIFSLGAGVFSSRGKKRRENPRYLSLSLTSEK